MKKNKNDHSCGNGIIVNAKGIVMNDNAGPPDATLSMSRPVLTRNNEMNVLLAQLFLCVKFTRFLFHPHYHMRCIRSRRR